MLIGAGALIAGLTACKGKPADKNEGKTTAPTTSNSGKTTQSSDNAKSVEVPKKSPPPPASELPSDESKHEGAHKWSLRIGGPLRESARAVAFDKEGNIFIGGLLAGTVKVPGSDDMVADGHDAFILKMTPDGKPIWARNFGGAGTDMIESLDVDAEGNVIVGGTFAEELFIGDARLPNGGSDDGFVAKFDGDGKRLWAKRIGGLAEDNIAGVAVDPSGNIFVSASFRAAVTLGEERFVTKGIDDAYLISLGPDGSYRWVKRLASPGIEYGRKVTTNKAGEIFWSAEFSQTAAVDTTELSSAGNRDVAIIKFSPAGAALWATSYGGLADDNVLDIDVDEGNDTVVTGTFKESMTIGQTEVKSNGEADAYVAKLAADGSLRWVKTWGTKTEDVGAAVATDGFGNVYAGGWFRGSVDFGGGALKSSGEKDIYMVKLSRTGDHLWSRHYGGKQVDFVRAIATTKDNEPVFVGTFYLTANFGGEDLVANSGDGKLPAGEIYAVKLAR